LRSFEDVGGRAMRKKEGGKKGAGEVNLGTGPGEPTQR